MKLFYRNDTTVEPYPQQLPGCSLDCPLREFVRITKLSISDDRDKECQLPSKGTDTSEMLTHKLNAKVKAVKMTKISNYLLCLRRQGWSSVWRCRAVCCSYSSPSSSALSVGRRSRPALTDIAMCSVRKAVRSPDKHTNCSFGDAQVWRLGTAVMMENSKLNEACLRPEFSFKPDISVSAGSEGRNILNDFYKSTLNYCTTVNVCT